MALPGHCTTDAREDIKLPVPQTHLGAFAQAVLSVRSRAFPVPCHLANTSAAFKCHVQCPLSCEASPTSVSLHSVLSFHQSPEPSVQYLEPPHFPSPSRPFSPDMEPVEGTGQVLCHSARKGFIINHRGLRGSQLREPHRGSVKGGGAGSERGEGNHTGGPGQPGWEATGAGPPGFSSNSSG